MPKYNDEHQFEQYCEQAPALMDADSHCSALNRNSGNLQNVINIASRFTGIVFSSSRQGGCTHVPSRPHLGYVDFQRFVICCRRLRGAQRVH